MNFFDISLQETAKILNTDLKNGLDEKTAQRLLLKYGRNKIQAKKKKSVISRFIAQFNDFMIIILLAAAAVSFFTSFLAGEKDLTDPIIILVIVMLNALIGTVQEMRAENSLEALKKLSSPHAFVIRGGKEYKTDSEEIVPGDLIHLRAGDMVCADCRLVSCYSLTVDESPLTGETHAVCKDADIIHDSLTATADIKNMVFSSTLITGGDGYAVAVKTGMETEVGKIAAMLTDSAPQSTPLQKKLAATGRTLCVTALFICGIIFIIGTIKHIPPFEMFMTSVSLAVAAIPEGLPAIVTIMLAIGVMRMSRHNAIVRNLPSVETLGCATVICTDKTGTLTENKLKAEVVKASDEKQLLELAALCTESGEYINPTDAAVINAAKEYKIDVSSLKERYSRKELIPFDSSRKRMSVLCGNKTIVKGAIEYILPLCGTYQTGGKTVKLTASAAQRILKENSAMTQKALRVIAVAAREDNSSKIEEKDLTFIGMIGFIDPPRKESVSAVQSCRDAGIRTIMITGDHAETALRIAQLTGIAEDGEKAVTGNELDAADDSTLMEMIKSTNVFARVSPAHKSRIVDALQKNGEITAMTGDGVNDAPALKRADIGCSMGINGTDVAKSASDIILTDDNFATIVYAVKEGRAIYDNIRKSVKFLLSSNIGEILTVMMGIIMGIGSPLSAIMLLWVNLVTDSFPAIALGLDPEESDIMQRSPLKPGKSIFSKGLWSAIALEGMMIGALSLTAYGFGLVLEQNSAVAATMAFFVLSVSQLVHSFNMRSDKPVIGKELFKNKYLVLSFALGIALQLSVMYVPFTASLLGVVPISTVCLIICFALSVMPLLIVEAQKVLTVNAKSIKHKNQQTQ